MISAEILCRLVPARLPPGDFPYDQRLLDLEASCPGRRIGQWASYLRHNLGIQAQKNSRLGELFNGSGLIATGVFRAPGAMRPWSSDEFPIVCGYQFGAVLFRAVRYHAPPDDYLTPLTLEYGRVEIPMVQTLATFTPHTPVVPKGYPAALYVDREGTPCGITAGHVVQQHRIGQSVPILCPTCGTPSRLAARAPGFIDAAKITFPCGKRGHKSLGEEISPNRYAIEGEAAEVHFGDTGRAPSTVMMSLSTPAQILSGVTPHYFLTDAHGHPGDSGSLVAAPRKDPQKAPSLLGLYLGDTYCQDQNGAFFTYGHGLNMVPAALMLDARDLQGVFAL